MKEKGQIISLDAVIALIIVMSALGVMFNLMETNAYSLKEEQLFEELLIVGRVASNLLISSPEIICEVEGGGQELFSMNNCIDSSKDITKEMLGIAEKYGCYVEGITVVDCENDLSAEKENVYSEKRNVIINDGLISKQKFEQKNFTAEEITLKVWKE